MFLTLNSLFLFWLIISYETRISSALWLLKHDYWKSKSKKKSIVVEKFSSIHFIKSYLSEMSSIRNSKKISVSFWTESYGELNTKESDLVHYTIPWHRIFFYFLYNPIKFVKFYILSFYEIEEDIACAVNSFFF